MILMVSGRTDIVAFYSDWFYKRYKEGFVDVRNPFNKKLVSRINFEDVDIIMFCTKNPHPVLSYIKEIKQPIIFHITLTPYLKDIEPNVPNKKEVIEDIKELSRILGKENVVVRYDPILLNDKYNLDYHTKMFDRVCENLDGYIETIIVSFIDDYKNVRNNMKELKYRDLEEDDYKTIGEKFALSAQNHNMKVQTCFEERNLVEFGFVKGDCLSPQIAYQLTGKKFPAWKARKGGLCSCVQMVDIGEYNTCSHFCKYCYANYDEKEVLNNKKLHNPNSSLLIGEIESDDIIKIRKK